MPHDLTSRSAGPRGGDGPLGPSREARARRGPRRALWASCAVVLLGVAAVYLVSGMARNLFVVGPGYTNRLGNAVNTDFTAFYAAAELARQGRSREVYDIDALHRAHEEVRGIAIHRKYAWAYPPTMLLLLLPLASMPLVVAMWTWLIGTTAVVCLAAYRVVPSALTPLVVVLYPGLATSWFTGPTGTFSAAVAMLGLALLDRAPYVAGSVLGLLSVKPHLAVLIPLCLLASGRRQALVACVCAAAAMMVASVAVFGIGPWMDLRLALPRHMDYLATEQGVWMRMPTPFVAIRHATGSATLAWWGQLATTALCLGGCIWVWRRNRDGYARALALCASIPLVAPYAYDYDTSVLIAPLIYGIRNVLDAPSAGAHEAGTLVLLWVLPFAIWLGSAALGQQIGPLLLAILLMEALRSTRSGPRAIPASARMA